MRLWPSSPLSLPSPFGKRAERVLSSNAVEFSAEAHRNTTLREILGGLARVRVDDAHAGHAILAFVVDQRMHHGIRLQREIARGRRGRQRHAVRGKIRAERTAARALIASLARSAAIVLAGQHRRGAADELALAAELRRHVAADVFLERIHLERRLQDLLRQLRKSGVLAARADETLDVFVPGRDVGVADGPVDAHALALVGRRNPDRCNGTRGAPT